jgi:hypothetical protein
MSNINGMASMSSDALLAYCRYQLGGLDQDMHAEIEDQNQRLADRQAVEKVQSTLESFGTQGPQDVKAMGQCYDAFQQAIQSLDANDPVRAELQSQCDKMCQTYGYNPGGEGFLIVSGEAHGLPNAPTLDPDKKPHDDEWKGTTEAVSNLVSDIKSGAEIRMLQLQDLVSERQQAVELSTGMMSKTDQTLEDQAKAIGR